MQKTKVTLIAPFWGQTGHVGNHRIERIARWLSSANLEVILLRAGSTDRLENFACGTIVTLRDPLNLYPESSINYSTRSAGRNPSNLRRQIAFWLFNPDPSIIWVRRACRHPLVLQTSRGSAFFMASSPPESGHVLAWALAKRFGGACCVDMRDGWVDEPLKQYLLKPGLRRWREMQLEKKVLQAAQHIFVTSSVWKKLLEDRLPFTRGKTAVITNTYPDDTPQKPDGLGIPVPPDRLRLIYAGQFAKSRPTQVPAMLWEPLLQGIKLFQPTGQVIVFGSIPPDEMAQMENWQYQFRQSGWELCFEPPMPRQSLLEQMVRAHGLLLLSATCAPIPSKIFDYIVTRRSILCVTPRGSAVWEMGSRIQQIFLADPEDPLQSQTASRNFLESCYRQERYFDVPDEFADRTVKRSFLNELGIRFQEADY